MTVLFAGNKEKPINIRYGDVLLHMLCTLTAQSYGHVKVDPTAAKLMLKVEPIKPAHCSCRERGICFNCKVWELSFIHSDLFKSKISITPCYILLIMCIVQISVKINTYAYRHTLTGKETCLMLMRNILYFDRTSLKMQAQKIQSETGLDVSFTWLIDRITEKNKKFMLWRVN